MTTPANPPGNDTGALVEGENGHQRPGSNAARLWQIHEAASEFGVFTLDQAGRIVNWNRLAEKACGYSADQIVGRNFSCLYTDAETADGEPSRALARAMAQGRCEEQAPRQHRDGSSFWADVTIVAVRDAAGNHCGFGCIVRDISGPGNTARAAALESSRLKSAFLANISHEFRTPLNIILGYNDLIGEHLAELRDSSQTECVEAVARACKRLLHTLNAVLDYSKLESSSFEIYPQTVKVVPLIRRLIAEVMPHLSKKGLTLAFEFDDEAVTVVFDEYCLSQALRNLLENAVKFTECGSVTVRLYRDAGAGLCLGVVDTGIGIDASFQPYLLEPFSQADSGMTRRFEGAGLGLALTRSYVELNGASLTVRSEKGHGSTFTIHFAQAAVAKPGKALSSGAESPVAAPAHQPPIEPMVMLVEDDPDNLILMRAMMKNHYRILAAASPAEVRDQIENYPATIDLILMDLGLRSPEDGLALTRSLRTLERFRTTPIVAVTGHAMSVNRAQALAAGCDDFIVKPFDRALLFATIERLLHPPR